MYSLAPAGSYSEDYRARQNGGGVSVKLSTKRTLQNVTQVEYTQNMTTGHVFYDFSNIDGYPFQQWGMAIYPFFKSSRQQPRNCLDNCCPVICPPGPGICTAAYNKPNDDFATHACPLATDLNVYLCESSL
ncbi:hypothetical protein BDV29DRAFT_163899 [Aspergillus leporis]|uniref:Uncharacterized protein n=1 Tax=Aspergillus leporis TaxID=41062 RepID=A0A5N5WFP2_9EURO|nr:hypothetical protein BDV29DRAFT_163899 [Aspergillus leporis]